MKNAKTSNIMILKPLALKMETLGILETFKTQWITKRYSVYGRIFDVIVQDNLAGLA